MHLRRKQLYITFKNNYTYSLLEIQLVIEFSLKLISCFRQKFNNLSVTYVHVEYIFL
jgi:hypothetical protein